MQSKRFKASGRPNENATNESQTALSSQQRNVAVNETLSPRELRCCCRCCSFLFHLGAEAFAYVSLRANKQLVAHGWRCFSSQPKREP